MWWYRKEKTNSQKRYHETKESIKKVNCKYLYLNNEKLKITYHKRNYYETPTVILGNKNQSTYYIKEEYKKR